MIENMIVMTDLAALAGPGLWMGLGWCALAGAGAAIWAMRRSHRRRMEMLSAWNAVGATIGTHEGSVTRKAATAISGKHLLGKVGGNATQVAIAGASDAPLYVMPDEAEAEGDAIACEILGVVSHTVRMVASDSIAAGTQVVPATNGRVRPLPSSAGTYYVVGRALTGSGDPGDLVEVASCVARQVVIS